MESAKQDQQPQPPFSVLSPSPAGIAAAANNNDDSNSYNKDSINDNSTSNNSNKKDSNNNSSNSINNNKTNQHHHPALIHTHTIDEKNISDYPVDVQVELLKALQLYNEKHNALRIGVVLVSTKVDDKAIRSIPSLISACLLTALTLLNYDNNTNDDTDGYAIARQWLQDHALGYPIFNRSSLSLEDQVSIYLGMSGYHEMLQSNQVDAVYVLCPTRQQTNIILEALYAKKHVLVNDPQSTTLPDFRKQVAAAEQAQRFIQFSTMFAHQYRVQTFLETVAYKLGWDKIQRMHLLLRVHPQDWNKVGVIAGNNPDNHHENDNNNNNNLDINKYELTQSHDNCIRRLARFGVLHALLLLQQKIQYQPVAVQITHAISNSFGICIEAAGIVWFTEGRKMTFDVGFNMPSLSTTDTKQLLQMCKPTRQVLEVHALDQYATMNDVSLEHADGDSVATYRIYEKECRQKWSSSSISNLSAATTTTTTTSTTMDLHVTGGDALDVVSGPPQSVMTWRRFAEICRAVEAPNNNLYINNNENKNDNDIKLQEQQQQQQLLRQKGQDFHRIAVQLKSILNCLEESHRQGNVRVSLGQDIVLFAPTATNVNPGAASAESDHINNNNNNDVANNTNNVITIKSLDSLS